MSTRKRHSCQHKQRHETREAAQAALNAIIRKRHASPLYMHAYKCRHCGAYHIGHRLGTGRKT